MHKTCHFFHRSHFQILQQPQLNSDLQNAVQIIPTTRVVTYAAQMSDRLNTSPPTNHVSVKAHGPLVSSTGRRPEELMSWAVVRRPSVCLSVCLSVCPSVCPSVNFLLVIATPHKQKVQEKSDLHHLNRNDMQLVLNENEVTGSSKMAATAAMLEILLSLLLMNDKPQKHGTFTILTGMTCSWS